MSYDRQAPTSSRCRTTARRQLFLLRPKNCLVPVTWVKIIDGVAVPLSDGLDTRPCKILDPHLIIHRLLASGNTSSALIINLLATMLTTTADQQQQTEHDQYTRGRSSTVNLHQQLAANIFYTYVHTHDGTQFYTNGGICFHKVP